MMLHCTCTPAHMQLTCGRYAQFTNMQMRRDYTAQLVALRKGSRQLVGSRHMRMHMYTCIHSFFLCWTRPVCKLRRAPPDVQWSLLYDIVAHFVRRMRLYLHKKPGSMCYKREVLNIEWHSSNRKCASFRTIAFSTPHWSSSRNCHFDPNWLRRESNLHLTATMHL